MEDSVYKGNYGGVVYGFNETSIRIWKPLDTLKKGFIAFVGKNIWGKGIYPQESNAADIVFKVWELQERGTNCMFNLLVFKAFTLPLI